MKKVKTKKKPQDLTLRNLRALKKRVEVLEAQMDNANAAIRNLARRTGNVI